ncbi:hypothetical protein CPAV1605_824 [seawater metagenome]|uniref:Uncharacterized protein n=1 Tax=seawater metagenome TaxID=1561972 RepID=A0A5E8CKA9_9ZZZZ
MSKLKDIIIYQRERMEELIKELKNIEDQIEDSNIEIYNYDSLTALEKIKQKIDKLENHISKFQYSQDKHFPRNPIINNRIKNYEIDDVVLKTFTPYMIYLRLLLDIRSETQST